MVLIVAIILHALSIVSPPMALMAALLLILVLAPAGWQEDKRKEAEVDYNYLPFWLENQIPRTRMMATRYKDIRASLKTGDIILFAGNNLFARLIQLATRSVWSHLAMIVRDGDSVLCWESGNKDVIEHDFANEYKLSEVVRAAQGAGEKVAVRLLDLERTEAMTACYRTFRDEVVGRPYEKDKLELIKAALGLNITDEDISSLFCSELVAETWQRMGLLSVTKDSNWYSPKDFSTLGSVKPLMGTLGAEILLEA